jgi:predicted enzyme related to lactoylglutathione lyase
MGAIGGLEAITIDCADPVGLAGFWAAVFGTGIDVVEGDPPHYVDLRSLPHVPVLRFQRVPEPKTVKNRLHLDVLVDDIERACSLVESLGGARVSEKEFAEYGVAWRIVADPEGNEFCLVRGGQDHDG